MRQAHGLRWAAVAAGLALLAAAGLAQEKRQAIRFGDIMLSNYAKAELELGVSAMAKGPDTTVDATDPKSGAQARLQAQSITAFLVPKARNEVERVEAVGAVRFWSSRAAEGVQGRQTVKATGTKGIYYKVEERLSLTGPLTFEAEQPSAGGKGAEKVTGSAEKAEYDAGKRSLTLTGHVEATVVTPDTPAEGSTFSGDSVRIDMRSRPYKVYIDNPSMDGSIKIRFKEQDKKP
jgi:lipopolysaccharide export system protein LptA